MAEIEVDYAKEYLWLWKEFIELSKKIPNDERIQKQMMRAQMNYVRTLALDSNKP